MRLRRFMLAAVLAMLVLPASVQARHAPPAAKPQTNALASVLAARKRPAGVASTAANTNPATFTDTANDGGTAPDLRTVIVSNDVAGNLFANEPVIGFVGIETVDDHITVTPGVLAKPVVLVALAFAVTDNVQPMAHALEMHNVFAEDALASSLPREAALANAPKKDAECYRVPAVLGE